MWHLSDGMGLGEWFLVASMILFWGGLIALIIWGVTRLSRRGDSTPKHGPLDIAKERYAKGEISREEFEQLKKDLS